MPNEIEIPQESVSPQEVQIEAISFLDKLKIHKFKILGGVVGALVFVGAVLGAYKFGQRPVLPGENCVRTDTGKKMSFSEAKEIALESKCVKEGNLKEEHFCNENTGTWWIDLDIEKEGCAPACVINISTREAEINWRCTGLISSEEKSFCEEPRSQVCTMLCIDNPPYICGSDGKSYCSECQACANPRVKWYVIQEEPCGP